MMVLGEYVYDISLTGGKALINSTTNRIISMTIRPGTFFNCRVIHMALAYSLITLIYFSISGTCSYEAVVLKVDITGIIIMILSKYLYMYNVSTYIPCV